MTLTLDHLPTEPIRVHLIGDYLLLREDIHILVWIVRHRYVLDVLLLGATALPREELLIVGVSRVHLTALLGRGALGLGKLRILIRVRLHARPSAIL